MNSDTDMSIIPDILENFKNFILLNMEDKIEPILKYLQEKTKNKKYGEIITNLINNIKKLY